MTYQREFATPINVGVIGIGSHCYRNVLPALNYLPVRLKAVCNRDATVGGVTAAQYGCRHYRTPAEMYDAEEIDAVFICVSPQMHPQLMIEALDAGKHVWVEKPIAMRADAVREIMAHRGDRVVVAGYKKAFAPATRKAVEIVNSPKYGELQSVLAVYPMTIPSDGAAQLDSPQVSNWLNNGVHPLSFLQAVGGRVASVTALCNASGHGVLTLQFANGAIGNLHLASGPSPRFERYAVFGKHWHLEIDNARVTLQRGIPFAYKETMNYAPAGDDSGAVVWEPSNCLATLENKALFTQGIVFAMMHYCDCIRAQRRPDQGTLEESLELMRIYEAGLMSDGKTIYLD